MAHRSPPDRLTKSTNLLQNLVKIIVVDGIVGVLYTLRRFSVGTYHDLPVSSGLLAKLCVVGRVG